MKIYFHLNIEGFSNCYVIVNELTSEAIIVDPGIITPQIIENIEKGGFTLAGVLVTHNHGSHVHGLQTLRKIYTPQIFAADWEVAGNETYVLKDEGIIQIAGLTVGYMSVPGHTPDSMVYKIGNVLFTGDVISAGKIGSSNNKFSEQALIKNINEKILSQQEETILMPGHGPPTTVAAEKMFNLAINPKETGIREKLGLI
ncbi:MAG: MBL fold metallo-hydrolase [Treponema sp.]|uniref:MBL fold metallo-hydrolase n=1 Tax=Treponema sp. TaxID=166 RepID=UPI001B5FC637|nr:MBL fold metallo-hydrolase [Treponema sp.]MBP5402288.1 MBL fold metallo-hydrolase [Treponema sp.]MBR5933214.1 MBL fold metallo-hydrolase [Treponema sp.]